MKVGMNMLLWTTSVQEQHFLLFGDLKAIGFDGLEIPVGGMSEAEARAVRGALDDHGLEATAVFALMEDANPVSPEEAARGRAVEELTVALDRARTLGAKTLCGPFHSAYKVFSGAPPTHEERTWSAEVLRAAGDVAKEAGVILAVEQLNRFECYLANTSLQMRGLLDETDHPSVKMLYDTHHAHIEEKSVRAAIEKSADYIAHVHVSENDRGTPGSGSVDWRSTFDSLKRIGYDGWLVIEAFSRLDAEFAAAIHIWRDFFDHPEDVAREGCRFIKSSWASST